MKAFNQLMIQDQACLLSVRPELVEGLQVCTYFNLDTNSIGIQPHSEGTS